jgi:uncharacterized protein (DUF433 family)
MSSSKFVLRGIMKAKEKKLLNRIERNPDIMLGKPVIKGTRLTVELLLEKLAYGYSEKEIIAEYPFISREDIQATLLYASRVISLEEEISI